MTAQMARSDESAAIQGPDRGWRVMEQMSVEETSFPDITSTLIPSEEVIGCCALPEGGYWCRGNG